MSITESISRETEVVETTRLRIRDISEELSVFDIWKGRRPVSEPFDEHRMNFVKQGFLDRENAGRLRAGHSDFETFVPIPSDGSRIFHPVLINAEGRRMMLERGHPLEVSKLWEWMESAGVLRRASFVDDFEGGASVDDLHFIASYDHSIVDRRGMPVPTAFQFNYLAGGLHNGCFDLEKALRVMKSNPEIEIVPERHTARLIRPVPYYNQDDGIQMCIEAVWRPGAESWQRLLDRSSGEVDRTGSRPTRFRRESLLLEYDVLGLVAAGCRIKNVKRDSEPPRP